jgi:hypothetical protein
LLDCIRAAVADTVADTVADADDYTDDGDEDDSNDDNGAGSVDAAVANGSMFRTTAADVAAGKHLPLEARLWFDTEAAGYQVSFVRDFQCYVCRYVLRHPTCETLVRS